MTHLWEADHPYYAEDGCYYVAGYQWDNVHTNYESWNDFIDEWGDSDHDMNLVYRWDWNVTDPAHYSYELSQDPEFKLPADTLHIYFMLQRKAIPHSICINITEEDEPAVREWLTERAKTIRAIWEPIIERARKEPVVSRGADPEEEEKA